MQERVDSYILYSTCVIDARRGTGLLSRRSTDDVVYYFNSIEGESQHHSKCTFLTFALADRYHFFYSIFSPSYSTCMYTTILHRIQFHPLLSSPSPQIHPPPSSPADDTTLYSLRCPPIPLSCADLPAACNTARSEGVCGRRMTKLFRTGWVWNSRGTIGLSSPSKSAGGLCGRASRGFEMRFLESRILLWRARVLGVSSGRLALVVERRDQRWVSRAGGGRGRLSWEL